MWTRERLGHPSAGEIALREPSAVQNIAAGAATAPNTLAELSTPVAHDRLTPVKNLADDLAILFRFATGRDYSAAQSSGTGPVSPHPER